MLNYAIMVKRTPTTLLTGKEPLTCGGKPTQYTVLDYWRFQFSNIYHVQEEIAEFIVSMALGIEAPMNKNLWTTWDIDYRGKRIEVKETGYFIPLTRMGKYHSREPLVYRRHIPSIRTTNRLTNGRMTCISFA